MPMGAFNRTLLGPDGPKPEQPAAEAGTADKRKIFVVEDDADIARLVRHNLEAAGYSVRCYSTTHAVMQDAHKEHPALMLLDIMLPGGDGLELCRQVRQSGQALSRLPIVFLTAKTGEADRIRGLEIGADDYITKPFSIQELLMRMEVFLRRTRKMHSEKTQAFTIGQLNFSYTDLKLAIGQETFNLTQKEADLLKFLCEHSNRILKREEVLLNVWGKDDYFLGRSMDVFITKLRKYFKADPHVNLETIHGVGFRFNTPQE